MPYPYLLIFRWRSSGPCRRAMFHLVRTNRDGRRASCRPHASMRHCLATRRVASLSREALPKSSIRCLGCGAFSFKYHRGRVIDSPSLPFSLTATVRRRRIPYHEKYKKSRGLAVANVVGQLVSLALLSSVFICAGFPSPCRDSFLASMAMVFRSGLGTIAARLRCCSHGVLPASHLPSSRLCHCRSLAASLRWSRDPCCEGRDVDSARGTSWRFGHGGAALVSGHCLRSKNKGYGRAQAACCVRAGDSGTAIGRRLCF